ncbi:hypothetical protein PMIN07_003417 [Paraphaeosphaeria minitans]
MHACALCFLDPSQSSRLLLLLLLLTTPKLSRRGPAACSALHNVSIAPQARDAAPLAVCPPRTRRALTAPHCRGPPLPPPVCQRRQLTGPRFVREHTQPSPHPSTMVLVAVFI